jgi:hypothetical protein
MVRAKPREEEEHTTTRSSLSPGLAQNDRTRVVPLEEASCLPLVSRLCLFTAVRCGRQGDLLGGLDELGRVVLGNGRGVHGHAAGVAVPPLCARPLQQGREFLVLLTPKKVSKRASLG